jgi:hypothetical protein
MPFLPLSGSSVLRQARKVGIKVLEAELMWPNLR